MIASPQFLSLVLLGTGNPLPDPQRAGAATLVRAGDRRFLVDAGRGVCMRLAAAATLPIMLDSVLLTHLHSDHVCDLNDIVTTHWVMSREPKAIALYGPEGTARLVGGLLDMLAADISYRLAHHADLTWGPEVDVHEIGAGVLVDDGTLRIVVAETDHRPVSPSLAYRFEFGGRAVVVAGDTLPCPGLDDLCAGADVYVQSVLREDLVRLVPMQRFQDTVDYHSTVEQAARTAAKAKVRALVLTHQVPTPADGAADEWVAMARRHFDGEVVFGKDLLEI
jgi:ribonuclease Z